MNRHIFKFYIFFLLFFPLNLFADHSYFSSVKQKLIRDGFNKKMIEAIYSPQEITYEFDSVTLFFTISEHKLNYAQFLSKKNIEKGVEYIKKYRKDFQAAEKRFNVPPEIITAIISVETRLGTFTGNKKVLSSLSSIAALGDYKVRKMVKKSVKSRKNRYSGLKFKKRAEQKSRWAYKELKELIKYSIKSEIDPLKIIGSYAGATGIPQFMPSNILRYGKDGNGDGKINLLEHRDAIFSVGNYLKSHGWTKKPKESIALGVIMKYNKSTPYAQTILKLAREIRKAENNGH